MASFVLNGCGTGSQHPPEPPSQHPPEPPAGAAEAAICISCHGGLNVRRRSFAPDLSARSAEYLIDAMRAYGDGRRNSPEMGMFVNNLSRQEREIIAAFFAKSKDRTHSDH